jgi:hypothetical protein
MQECYTLMSMYIMEMESNRPSILQIESWLWAFISMEINFSQELAVLILLDKEKVNTTL